jgi:virulence-associated protein VagC
LHNIDPLSAFRQLDACRTTAEARIRLEGCDEVLISRDGHRLILDPRRRSWSGAFLDLAGSEPDFPEPAEPPVVEPGPELD